MKKILSLLALTATISIANTNSSTNLTDSQSIDILTKSQTVIREVRTTREARKTREHREYRLLKIKKIDEVSSLPIARSSREVRKDRLVVQTIRENRKIRHVLIQNNLYFASLK
jgi:hypothetical protein